MYQFEMIPSMVLRGIQGLPDSLMNGRPDDNELRPLHCNDFRICDIMIRLIFHVVATHDQFNLVILCLDSLFPTFNVPC